jgi:twitching motility protein PilT
MSAKETLEELLLETINQNGSDLHLSEGRKPIIRISGDLVGLEKYEVFTKDDIVSFLREMINEDLVKIFNEKQQVDFSHSFKEQARFRGNAFVQRGAFGIVLRLIPRDIKSIDELNLPQVLKEFANKKQGFFLVVGPVGQGKTTTLASMIEKINRERTEHIITIEDPVEYVYDQKNSIIDQREVKIDTPTFEDGLNGTFRQDVDVILVGEMRNRETISAAVTAAETGHLVFSTLHTNNASQTVDRIIDIFPANQQDQIRMQLASSLIGIFSQRLIPRISGGQVPAYELLINNNAVSNLIREKRTHEIDNVIETSSELGMIDMNRTLSDLVTKGEITAENAILHSFRPEVLKKMI